VNRYLLDTHTFIWWVEDSPKLSVTAREIIGKLDNACFFSLASAWEMAIKCSLGKLKLTVPLRKYIPEQMAANDFKLLPISFSHTCKVETLPLHHRDPFDRLLVVQAMTEKMAIISADTSLNDYHISRVW
jgi:PIN domain nuclease of toxin-antitoxin system